jgi:hypothetical protein
VIALNNVKIVLLVALAIVAAVSGGGFFDDVLVGL